MLFCFLRALFEEFRYVTQLCKCERASGWSNYESKYGWATSVLREPHEITSMKYQTPPALSPPNRINLQSSYGFLGLAATCSPNWWPYSDISLRSCNCWWEEKGQGKARNSAHLLDLRCFQQSTVLCSQILVKLLHANVNVATSQGGWEIFYELMQLLLCLILSQHSGYDFFPW